MKITVEASGPATPDSVWQQYREPARWPTWAPQIKAVICRDQQIQVGTVGTVVGHLKVSVAFEVTAVDPVGRSWAWRVRAPLGIRLSLAHAVTDRPDGSATSLTIQGFAPVVLAYAPIARLALRSLVRTP